MAIIITTAAILSDTHFGGRATGCVRAPKGFTSEGRPVSFIAIARGSRRVTLSGVIAGRKWKETYEHDRVRVDLC